MQRSPTPGSLRQTKTSGTTATLYALALGPPFNPERALSPTLSIEPASPSPNLRTRSVRPPRGRRGKCFIYSQRRPGRAPRAVCKAPRHFMDANRPRRSVVAAVVAADHRGGGPGHPAIEDATPAATTVPPGIRKSPKNTGRRLAPCEAVTCAGLVAVAPRGRNIPGPARVRSARRDCRTRAGACRGDLRRALRDLSICVR